MPNIAALFVAGTGALDDNGAIHTTGIPTTRFQVDQMPLTAGVPVVLVVHARSGGDHDAELHVACKDPAGMPRGSLQASCTGRTMATDPPKYRCFTEILTFSVEAEGEYTIGAYYDAQGKIEMATPVTVSISLVAASPVAGAGDGADGEG
jgi:hypothetical protein